MLIAIITYVTETASTAGTDYGKESMIRAVCHVVSNLEQTLAGAPSWRYTRRTEKSDRRS